MCLVNPEGGDGVQELGEKGVHALAFGTTLPSELIQKLWEFLRGQQEPTRHHSQNSTKCEHASLNVPAHAVAKTFGDFRPHLVHVGPSHGVGALWFQLAVYLHESVELVHALLIA